MDGKSLRGSRIATRTAVHLLAVVVRGERAVITRRQVDTKSNEITAFQPLLTSFELAGTVVTFDVLLTQTDHARFLVEEKNAHCIAGQGRPSRPSSGGGAAARRDVPLLDKTCQTGHGHDEIRRLKAATVTRSPSRTPCRRFRSCGRRRDIRTGKVTIERVYAVISLTAEQGHCVPTCRGRRRAPASGRIAPRP
ncbi:hypothetical protein [Streptomyces sp. NPDC059452]|uniref:hypothetical protein n=1 Tax=Streptomyces sp. NPDC059452 TaxID=3346835 RepID=UPI00369B2328